MPTPLHTLYFETPLLAPLYFEIELTQGQVAIVDSVDYEYLMQWKWCAIWNASLQSYYAVRQVRIKQGHLIQRHFSMHREILGLKWGDPRQADHINHKTLDNRRSNLRVATKEQNQWNQGAQRNNKCGFKGVSWHTQKARWRAGIRLDRRSVHLGYFDTPEEAHKAYCIASKEAHGEFSGTI